MSKNLRLPLQIRVSRSPPPAKRKTTKSKAGKQVQPSSTLLTSPITPAQQSRKGKERFIEEGNEISDEDFHPSTYPQHDPSNSDGVESSEDDAFEPMRHRSRSIRNSRQADRLGPPIVAEGGMENVSPVHQDVIDEFIQHAKEMEESLRNKNGHRKPYFTEREFRYMATHWTTSIPLMSQIPGISKENIDSYGKRFLKMLEEHHLGYRQMLDPTFKSDKNLLIVNLVSDDEDSEMGDGYGDEPEEPSPYFPDPRVQEFNERMRLAAQVPRTQPAEAESKKSYQKGSSSQKSKSHGGYKNYRRKSGGSTTSRAGSSSGVTKKKAPSTGRKASTASKGSSVMAQFGRNAGGGGGSGINPMPT